MDLFLDTNAHEWVNALRQRAMQAKPGTTALVDMTPERAAELMRHNSDNRILSLNHVNKIARDMLTKRWVLNGEAIIISDTGELNDGQHRLQAVIQSGMSVQMLVTMGIKREYRTTTNMARSKRVADLLSMDGISGGTTMQAAASLLHAFENNLILRSYKGAHAALTNPAKAPSKPELLNFIRDNLTDLKLAVSLTSEKSRKICSDSRLAGMFLVLARTSGDWKAAEDYITAIITGAGLDANDPRYLTREKLMDLRTKGASLPAVVEAIIRGWNIYRREKVVSRIIVTGEIPQIEN